MDIFWHLLDIFLTSFQQLFDYISPNFRQLFANFTSAYGPRFDIFLTISDFNNKNSKTRRIHKNLLIFNFAGRLCQIMMKWETNF